MKSSPFHIYYKARLLSGLTNSNDKLIPAFVSANIEIYPYQIAALLFALLSPYINDVILADEDSLSKTFEALLVATQRWYEGREKQLFVLPANLSRQWTAKIESSFMLFSDGMWLDLLLEEQMKAFVENEQQLTAKLDKQYVIKVEGR